MDVDNIMLYISILPFAYHGSFPLRHASGAPTSRAQPRALQNRVCKKLIGT